MNTKRYYVSVQAGTILEDKGSAAYELEIDATEDDVLLLQNLFNQMQYADHHSFWRVHVPAVPYHIDEENDQYDDVIRQVYAFLFEKGTAETKHHIHTMHLNDGASLGTEHDH